MRIVLPLLCIALSLGGAPDALAARTSLGIFENWGAFRDTVPDRCFAIATPQHKTTTSQWRGFASVAHWPAQMVRGQIHFRLSRARDVQSPVMLTIQSRQFTLVAGEADAWATDVRMDNAIVTAMRSAASMTVTTRDKHGRRFSDSYALRGAATAIDAAALACARRR